MTASKGPNYARARTGRTRVAGAELGDALSASSSHTHNSITDSRNGGSGRAARGIRPARACAHTTGSGHQTLGDLVRGQEPVHVRLLAERRLRAGSGSWLEINGMQSPSMPRFPGVPASRSRPARRLAFAGAAVGPLLVSRRGDGRRVTVAASALASPQAVVTAVGPDYAAEAPLATRDGAAAATLTLPRRKGLYRIGIADVGAPGRARLATANVRVR